MSHALCLRACICLFVCHFLLGEQHKHVKWQAVICGVLWLLWACYSGYDFWQELGYWPRFVKWSAWLFPFTPLRPHLTFRSDCTYASLHVHFQTTHTHTRPALKMSKNIDLFFNIFLLTCQSKSVLIQWPSHLQYIRSICVDVSRLSLLQGCG